MDKICPTKVLFIKLGKEGEWEKECVEEEQTLRIGFNEVEHKDCIEKKWDNIKNRYNKKPSQTGSKYVTQMKYFYEDGESTLWITFYKQKMWWCFASQKFSDKKTNIKKRKVKGKWHCTDINGNELLFENLSGNLTKVQGYRGTICKVVDVDYTKRKINGEKISEVFKVEEDFQKLRNSLSSLIQKLTPKDFEILIDLIFRNAGYQRIGVIGGPQKTKDIELLAPVKEERCLVQVKSTSNLSQFLEYKKHFEGLKEYDKYYYIVHSPTKDLDGYQSKNDKIEIWKMNKITDFSVNSGLVKWILNKVN